MSEIGVRGTFIVSVAVTSWVVIAVYADDGDDDVVVVAAAVVVFMVVLLFIFAPFAYLCSGRLQRF